VSHLWSKPTSLQLIEGFSRYFLLSTIQKVTGSQAKPFPGK